MPSTPQPKGHPAFSQQHGRHRSIGRSGRSGGATVLAAPPAGRRSGSRGLRGVAAATSALVAAGFLVANASAETPFDLNVAAGHSSSYTDPSGTVYAADKHYSDGSVYRGGVNIRGTKADALYQRHRWGMSGYALPVDCAGTYNVTLHFAETVMNKSGRRVFGVAAEGTTKIAKLDVFAAVGVNRALQRSFDVTVKDGTLNLDFQRIVEDPMVSGIQVSRTSNCSGSAPAPAPSTSAPAPTTQAPAPSTPAPAPSTPAAGSFSGRLNVASNSSYTDASGKVWSPDAGFVGGSVWQGGDKAIANTTSDTLYRKHRWGMSGYKISVPSPGKYEVDLHLAELVFSSPGRRVFDVTAEGALKLDNLDVLAKAGGPDRALTETFVVDVQDGTLNLGFSASADDPMVSGIEVSTAGASQPAPTTSAPAPTTQAPAPTTAAPAPTTQAPSSGGFPNASNTGVPAGVTLKPSGSITVTQNGTVIDGLDVSGSIRVQANNVTIKRTRIRNPGGQAITVSPSTSGTVIEDVELDGTGNKDSSSAVGDSNYTIRRAHIHHFGEGPRANGNVLIEDSYMHSFLNFIAQGAHQDVIQSTGGSNLTFRHNTMLMNVDGGNAAIMIGTYTGSNLLIDNNLLAGGGYTVYGGDSHNWTNVRITNNRFSTMFYPKSGYHGPLLYAANATKSGNVWHESGNPL